MIKKKKKAFILNSSSSLKTVVNYKKKKKKRRMSHICRGLWILPAVGLTDCIKIRTHTSPFLQKLPSTAEEEKVGGREGHWEKAEVAWLCLHKETASHAYAIKSHRNCPKNGHVCRTVACSTSLSTDRYLTVHPGAGQHQSGSVFSTPSLCTNTKPRNIATAQMRNCFSCPQLTACNCGRTLKPFTKLAL